MKEKILNCRDRWLIKISNTCEKVLIRRQKSKIHRRDKYIEANFQRFKTEMKIVVDQNLMMYRTEDNFGVIDDHGYYGKGGIELESFQHLE